MGETGISASEIKDLLGQIKGIDSVQVRQAPTGEIEAIDIAISPPTPERRVIRDVESALMSGLGIQVDHRTIRVSRTNGGHESPPATNGSGLQGAPAEPGKSLAARFMQPTEASEERIRLIDVRCEPDGERYCDITVGLSVGEERVERTVREADTQRGRMLAAGRAMADAITTVIGDDAAIALEGVEGFSICEADGLLALLRIRQGRMRQDFYGAALVEGDPTEAAARAVLDAMNRFLETRDRNATMNS